MSALGELIGAIIYWIIILGGLVSLILAIILKGILKKAVTAAICSLCIVLILLIPKKRKSDYRRSQLEHVGTYYLTNYPNCDSCIAILKDDNMYEVKQNKNIIESGNWHFEMGGDYLIVYMNNDSGQLGSGRFQFDKFKDTNNVIYNSPLTPNELKNKIH
jgi:hypothetical protein